MYRYPQVINTFTILFFVVGVLLFPHQAFALNVNADTGLHVQGTINGSGYFHVLPVDISGFDASSGHVLLITGCEANGNCDKGADGYSAFSPNALAPDPNHTNGASGAVWDDVASTTDVSTVNGSLIYGYIHGIWPTDYCSGTLPVVCTGAILTDVGWTGGPPNFHVSAGSPYVLFTVDSTGLVVMNNTGAVSRSTITRIDSVDPDNNQSVATSSLPYLFDVKGYINPTDYKAGARLMMKIDRNTDQQSSDALVGFNSAFGNKTYLPITASTTFDVSTTSDNLNLSFPLRVGLYKARWEIQEPGFDIFGLNFFYHTVIGKDTVFTIATTTAIDNIQLQQEAYLNTIKNATGDPLAECQFSVFNTALDFSLGGQLINCMGGIISWMLIPSPAVLSSTIQQLKDGFLTRPPMGYLTRIVSAIQNGQQGTLPNVSVDVPIPDTDTDHTGKITIGFDINQWIADTADLEATFQDPAGHSAKTIIEPIIQLLVGLLVMMFIWNDLHGKLSRL